MFSIQTFEALNETCNCEMEIADRKRAVIKCFWAINEIGTYISLTASTFSIAYAVIRNGYVDFLLDDTCCGLSKVSFYVVGLFSQICGMTLGIYLIFIKSLKHSPYFFFLFSLLLVRIAPFNILYNILIKIFPGSSLHDKAFTYIPTRVKRTLVICSPFWFLGGIRGLCSSATLLNSISVVLRGHHEIEPFESVYPSVDLKVECRWSENIFGCIRFNGGIDKEYSDLIVQKIYPKYGLAANVTANSIDFLAKEAQFEDYNPSLRLYLGNYRILEPMYQFENAIHMLNFCSLLIFNELLIVSMRDSLKEKVIMSMIMIIQTCPLLINLFLLIDSDQANICAMLATITFMTTDIILLFVFCRDAIRSVNIKAFVYLFTYLSVICIPALIACIQYRVSSIQYRELYFGVLVHCWRSNPERIRRTISFKSRHFNHERNLHIIKQILPKDTVQFILSLTERLRLFTQSSFQNAAWELYHPFMMCILLVPLTSLGFFDLSRLKSAGFIRNFIISIFVSTSVAVLPMMIYFYEPQRLDGITWNGIHQEIYDFTDLNNYRLGYTTAIWTSSTKVDIDLATLTQVQTEWVLREVKSRLPELIENLMGLGGCGFESDLRMVAEIFENFRYQYITISRYLLYKCGGLFVLVSIPAAVFLCMTVILQGLSSQLSGLQIDISQPPE